jgi:branched-chain amino acid transport system substrate-binding protein
MAGFVALAKKHANAADIPKMNRYTAIGYVAMKVLAEGMKQCGRNLTRACTMSKLEGMKDFKTGIMPPISFSAKQHLSEVSGYPILLDMKQKKFLPYPR